MNTTKLLQRRALPEVDPGDLMTEEVLDYAHLQLGYHHPKKEHLCNEGSLAKALRVAGIVPFSHDSVRNYKAAQVKKFEGNRGLAMFFLKAAIITFAISVASVLIYLGFFEVGILKTISGHITLGTAVTFAACFITSMYMVIDTKEALWRRSPLKDYQSPVPGFALATAKEIHQRVPRAAFFIDELIFLQRQQDPFLIVSGDGGEYYVEVWDEPGYEQKRKA